jgi:hypothetical protein
MARRNRAQRPRDYYKALGKRLAFEAKHLTPAIAHKGERGRNDELRLQDFLKRVLPGRYSIGSGFVTCPDETKAGQQRHRDIVIYDEHPNAPIFREAASSGFPAEMVYGSVEVKADLQTSDLDEIHKHITEFRAISKSRSIAAWVTTPGRRGVQREVQAVSGAARSFIFSYNARWSTPEAFQQAIARTFSKPGAHLHGIIVLEKGWFMRQLAYKSPAQFNFFADNALARFVAHMIDEMSLVPVGPAALDLYLKLPKDSAVSVTAHD